MNTKSSLQTPGCQSGHCFQDMLLPNIIGRQILELQLYANASESIYLKTPCDSAFNNLYIPSHRSCPYNSSRLKHRHSVLNLSVPCMCKTYQKVLEALRKIQGSSVGRIGGSWNLVVKQLHRLEQMRVRLLRSTFKVA